ncbi:MAG: ATP-binding cassette domain-containing protein, partial [Alphaproteobacteria bacterium]|nr:ATP-binding cassette domain-containing protein [Alphaproteobacteria bacterium]
MEPSNILECRSIQQNFAGIQALRSIDLSIATGEFHAIIGPNGAGKTTLFNIISGVQSPSSGSVLFNQQAITALPGWRRARLGIARSFQNLRLFGAMSLRENILVAAQQRQPYSLGELFLRRGKVREIEKTLAERADELLEFVGLYDRRHQAAMNLPYGAARRLELARALALEPSLLLLDEPAAGLNPSETAALAEVIERLRNNQQLTV